MGSRRVGLGLGGYWGGFAESAGIGTWVADAVLCMGGVVVWAVGAACGAVLCLAIVDVGVLNLFGCHLSGELMLRCDDGWSCQRIWRHKTKQPRDIVSGLRTFGGR